ncbi:MAG: glycogen/starch/alpha-glucan phosphorylase [Rubrivivax sp.]|nr:glycogen/starch/alpha-glucan phosphorylase [Rubrivivax sp.]
MDTPTLDHRPRTLGEQELDEFRRTVRRELAQRSDGTHPAAALQAVAVAVRGLLAQRWAATQTTDAQTADAQRRQRRVHYLSMEFLMGRALDNALQALGLRDEVLAAVGPGAPALQAILDQEPDAALGNGGLGRLAACFLDAFASLGLPSFGYGLRYEHGMFAQAIEGGRQVERPDPWLEHGHPWELVRPELVYVVGFGGTVSHDAGRPRWLPAETVLAQANDFIVPGHGTPRVSTLRQWRARASRPIDFAAFCAGAHQASAAHKQEADALNWVLYPDDSTHAGRRLRLRQEFFLVSASLQDMLARHLREQPDVASFGRHNAVHLNDTHPALAPAELMRLLLDQHGLGWDAAWAITRQATSYTNHTLMPEALETWPVPLLAELLPRHLAILYEINRRFLDEVRARCPGDEALVQRVSLIDEGADQGGERRARMATLAILASQRVNGVSALHSQLMVQTIFADYARLWPERFFNVTNGVTPRRWLAQANPGLATLLDRHLGDGWRRNLTQLSALAQQADNPRLGAEFARVKLASKQALAQRIARDTGVQVDPTSMFDVQIKRIHEYKRQLLNLLHVVARYQAIVAQPERDWTPRTVIFAGKAASAYVAAKQIIQLIHDVADVVNHDPRVGDRLKLVFLPNYGVSLAEAIIPAADLSEQISTAGTEASGTGNMKFALNGALTIGTWDGANIEMVQAIGEERLFIFGHRAEAVAQIKADGYDPQQHVRTNPALQQVLHAIGSGVFSRAQGNAGPPQVSLPPAGGGLGAAQAWGHSDPGRYAGLVQDLLQRDPYLVLADFADYVQTQARVDALYRHPAAWQAMALHNIAGMGSFSVDRTIGEYVQQVWGPTAH